MPDLHVAALTRIGGPCAGQKAPTERGFSCRLGNTRPVGSGPPDRTTTMRVVTAPVNQAEAAIPGSLVGVQTARLHAGEHRRPLGYSSPRCPRRRWRSRPMNHPITNAAKERDDHAHADEHIGENDSGAILDGHDARKRSASMPLYGQSSGSPRRFIRSPRECWGA